MRSMGPHHFLQGLLLVREGILNGLWGLQRPIHCSGSSVSLTGLVAGFVLCLVLCVWLLGPSGPSVPATSTCRAPAQAHCHRLQRLQFLCRGHPSSSALDFAWVSCSGGWRARRARKAGHRAGLTLQGRVRSPRATPAPKIYVILRSPGLSAPTRVNNASDFFHLTGRLEGSNVVCHSFPSLAEASAYCEGAGYQLPAQHQWRSLCQHLWKIALLG